jgi:hypothetical protein
MIMSTKNQNYTGKEISLKKQQRRQYIKETDIQKTEDRTDEDADEFENGNIFGINYRTPSFNVEIDFNVSNGISFKNFRIQSTNYNSDNRKKKNVNYGKS